MQTEEISARARHYRNTLVEYVSALLLKYTLCQSLHHPFNGLVQKIIHSLEMSRKYRRAPERVVHWLSVNLTLSAV